MGTLVNYRRDEHCVRLDMDDGRLNVCSPEMLGELHEAFDRAAGERVPVVLAGREGALSAGFDLKVLRGGSGEAAARLLNAGFTLIEKMISFPAPVVVACTGHAIAMGLFVLLSGDYRVGVSGPYRLTANEVAIGMRLPRTPMVLCRHKVGPAFFDRVVSLAEVFPPEGAVTAGILDRVVEADGLEDALGELVGTLGTLDMDAHRATKLRSRESLLEAVHAAVASDDSEFRAALSSS